MGGERIAEREVEPGEVEARGLPSRTRYLYRLAEPADVDVSHLEGWQRAHVLAEDFPRGSEWIRRYADTGRVVDGLTVESVEPTREEVRALGLPTQTRKLYRAAET